MEEARQVNQLADEIKQDAELQNLREIAQREIETARGSMLALKTEHEGRFDIHKLNAAQTVEETFVMIPKTVEKLSIDECEQAIEKANELQREIEQLALVAEEESQRKSRKIKTGMLMAGIALTIGTIGSFIGPFIRKNYVILGVCLLIGVACCCAPFLINWIEKRRKGDA